MHIRLLICLLFISVVSFAQNLKSGGRLKPEQANMDIRHIKIVLDVNPDIKTIDGFTETELLLKEPSGVLLFDLWHEMKVSKIWVNGKEAPFSHTSDDLVRIQTAGMLASGKVNVRIAYGGTPGIAVRPPWTGGFQWEKDSLGNPWIAVSCQSEGAKVYFPCKDHPSDEPNEGAEMIISVPKGLVVAAPGLLQKQTTKKNKTTWHYKTNYTISNYCLVFNVGNYKVAKRIYTSVSGKKIPMEYYVLEENLGKAEKLLDLFEQSSRILEKYFGEYPWANERIAASETPHLGMEHQTNIAYGNKYRYEKLGNSDFDWLLHHEYGHEWWANKVTNRDWAHMWIQEGICVFGDAMATRELAGEEAYLKRMQTTGRMTQNKFPVVRGEEVDSDSAYHGDIYGKGAFFMHTLRFVMGDTLFFPTLMKLATDPWYTYDNTVVTADVEALFSGAFGKSLKPLFQLFLYTTDKLEISIRQSGEDTYLVKLLNIDMALPLEINSANGLQKIVADKKGITIKSKSFIEADPRGFYLKKVIYE